MMAWKSSCEVTELVTKDELVSRLRAVGEAYYHDKHPFNVRMHEGSLSADELRTWILNRFYYQKNIPVKDALILSKLPSLEARRMWIGRIVDHDGSDGEAGGIELWLRLGEAAGLTRQQMQDDEQILPAVRFAVDDYVNFCRLRTWYEAVAASLTELFVPELMSRRITVFQEHYPFVASDGLEYFRRRVSQSQRDAEQALELVLAAAVTAEAQCNVVSALRFKCDVLWSILDAIEHASIRKG